MVLDKIEAVSGPIDRIVPPIILLSLAGFFGIALLIGIMKSINDVILKIPGTQLLYKEGAPLISTGLPIPGLRGTEEIGFKQNSEDWLFQ